jgi:beta-lactam-binding protein with PASTA domain
VALLVSRGPTGGDYVMPDLIGRDAERIVAGLRGAGLKVADVRYRGYAGVAPGIVLRQVPPAGQRVRRSDPIILDVSRTS